MVMGVEARRSGGGGYLEVLIEAFSYPSHRYLAFRPVWFGFWREREGRGFSARRGEER